MLIFLIVLILKRKVIFQATMKGVNVRKFAIIQKVSEIEAFFYGNIKFVFFKLFLR